MLLDNLALAVGQPLRLQDQRLGNRKDPDIVDQAGQGQSLQLVPLKPQSHPKLGGQDGNIDQIGDERRTVCPGEGLDHKPIAALHRLYYPSSDLGKGFHLDDRVVSHGLRQAGQFLLGHAIPVRTSLECWPWLCVGRVWA